MAKSDKLPFNPDLILPVGTQVVTRVERKVERRGRSAPKGPDR